MPVSNPVLNRASRLVDNIYGPRREEIVMYPASCYWYGHGYQQIWKWVPPIMMQNNVVQTITIQIHHTHKSAE